MKESASINSADTLLRNGGSLKFLSKFDVSAAYYQLALTPKAREIAAIVTPDSRQWLPNRVVYGLTNAPQVFQRIMNDIIGDLCWQTCLCYIDDILVYTKTFEEHLKTLQTLFS